MVSHPTQRHLKAVGLLTLILLLGACPNDDSEGAGGDAAVESTAPSAPTDAIGITIHFRGGNEKEVLQILTRLKEFRTCAAAKIDPVTQRAWALMKDGVDRHWAENEREMLRRTVPAPMTFVLSTWAYNEGDWFSQIQ